MLRELRPTELGLWLALWQIDPWGEQRADLRAAIGHSLLANINTDSSKRPQGWKPADFMPYRDREDDKPEEVDESLRNALLAAVPARRDRDRSEIKRRRKSLGKAK